MINNQQKGLLHSYSKAAELPDHVYRDILQKNASCNSAAAKAFSQAGFDRCMAALENILFQRVERHLVPDPIGHCKHIRNRTYWRNKCPQPDTLNNQQLNLINQLWDALAGHMPAATHTLDYFTGIVKRSIARDDIDITAVTEAEASHIIDALKALHRKYQS